MLCTEPHIEQCEASASEDSKLRKRGKSFTDDSMLCGEEATLSRRRLSRENLLFTLFRAPTLSIPKSGCIDLQMAVNNPFPPKISNNQPNKNVFFHFSIPKSGRIKSHFEENNPFPPKTGKKIPPQILSPRRIIALIRNKNR